ncbi:MAG: hypothetical protein IPP74_14180, partial [Alphaproteobacteria bacterium]|nr:hypothetical protein [Alphaproteobacteria bacterium]
TIPLTDKEVWKSYPRGMLRSRCISEGVRTVYPGIISGIYTDEEVEAFSEKERFNKARSVEVKVEETNAEMSHITGEVLPVVHTEAAATSKNFTLPEGITEEMYIALRDKFIEDATILKEKAIKNAHDVQILYLIRKDWYALCNGYMCKNDWFLPPLKVVNTMQDLVAGMQVRSIAKGHITYIDGCSTSLDDEINSMDYQQSAVLDSERQAGLNNDAADTLEHEIN